MRSFIVPIFIPHQGCPHRCVFCEQERITSRHGSPVGSADVDAVIRTAITSPRFDESDTAEVAFYGGTFTSLPGERMEALLGAVSPYLRRGLFDGVRVSTRPDAIDEERLVILKRHGVGMVELGCQSMDDRVLALSRRGHTAGDTVRAVGMLKDHGFKVGLQLMPGLPGDSPEGFRTTVTEVVALEPDAVRLYPALVLEGTELARLYREGGYLPLTLGRAVEMCMDACMRFEARGIPVIRIGLMSSPSLLETGQILAGPWHTAFGFLVRSGIHHRRLVPELVRERRAPDTRVVLRVPAGDVPLVRGYKNEGLAWIEQATGLRVASVVADESVPSGHAEVEVI